jgi:sec-independent protein translocase protein TatA
MFGHLGPLEISLIVLLFVVFFGGKKLPELARGLGQGMKEFKQAVRENTAEESKPEETKP